MFNGAQEGNRTPDLRITSALLYRLSYLGRLKKCRSATSHFISAFTRGSRPSVCRVWRRAKPAI